jgi:hypothetical protein
LLPIEIHKFFAPEKGPERLPVQHAEQVQQDDHADGNADQPKKKVAGHVFELQTCGQE